MQAVFAASSRQTEADRTLDILRGKQLPTWEDLHAHDASLQSLMKIAERLAPLPHAVVISGSQGSGRTTLARAMHAAGRGNVENIDVIDPLTDSSAKSIEDSSYRELYPDGNESTRRRSTSLHENAKHRSGIPEVQSFERRLATAIANSAEGTLIVTNLRLIPLDLQAIFIPHLGDRSIVAGMSADDRTGFGARIIFICDGSLSEGVRSGTVHPTLAARLRSSELYVPELDKTPERLKAMTSAFYQAHRRDAGQRFQETPEVLLEFARSRNWEGNLHELYQVTSLAAACSIEGSLTRKTLEELCASAPRTVRDVPEPRQVEQFSAARQIAIEQPSLPPRPAAIQVSSPRAIITETRTAESTSAPSVMKVEHPPLTPTRSPEGLVKEALSLIGAEGAIFQTGAKAKGGAYMSALYASLAVVAQGKYYAIAADEIRVPVKRLYELLTPVAEVTGFENGEAFAKALAKIELPKSTRSQAAKLTGISFSAWCKSHSINPAEKFVSRPTAVSSVEHSSISAAAESSKNGKHHPAERPMDLKSEEAAPEAAETPLAAASLPARPALIEEKTESEPQADSAGDTSDEQPQIRQVSVEPVAAHKDTDAAYRDICNRVREAREVLARTGSLEGISASARSGVAVAALIQTSNDVSLAADKIQVAYGNFYSMLPRIAKDWNLLSTSEVRATVNNILAKFPEEQRQQDLALDNWQVHLQKRIGGRQAASDSARTQVDVGTTSPGAHDPLASEEPRTRALPHTRPTPVMPASVEVRSPFAKDAKVDAGGRLWVDMVTTTQINSAVSVIERSVKLLTDIRKRDTSIVDRPNAPTVREALIALEYGQKGGDLERVAGTLRLGVPEVQLTMQNICTKAGGVDIRPGLVEYFGSRGIKILEHLPTWSLANWEHVASTLGAHRLVGVPVMGGSDAPSTNTAPKLSHVAMQIWQRQVLISAKWFESLSKLCSEPEPNRHDVISFSNAKEAFFWQAALKDGGDVNAMRIRLSDGTGYVVQRYEQAKAALGMELPDFIATARAQQLTCKEFALPPRIDLVDIEALLLKAAVKAFNEGTHVRKDWAANSLGLPSQADFERRWTNHLARIEDPKLEQRLAWLRASR